MLILILIYQKECMNITTYPVEIKEIRKDIINNLCQQFDNLDEM